MTAQFRRFSRYKTRSLARSPPRYGEDSARTRDARLAVSHTARPEAYSLYLKGRYFARNLTEEGQRKAIRYFRESIQADPDYASRYAGLAECFIQMAYFFGMEPKKAFEEAEPAAVKAVAWTKTWPKGMRR